MNDNANRVNQTLQPGDKISRFEVVSVLGVGGQAIVYKCHDPGLDRFVAVKQVAANLAHNKGYIDQLRRTVRTIATLGQKNEAIITVFELIEDETGFYYAMEFVEGHTLEFLLQEADGPIEVKATLLILFRMASALHEIHQSGIIHRDIKPNNIILTPGLRPKIIDFGVAALPDCDISMPLATTKYLAPELYAGDPPTGAADIYSLGFMAYEMLLGREKFNEVFSDILKDKSTASLRWMKWHGNEKVIAPALNTVNPQVPASLSNIVGRMIEKDLSKRIKDTEELGLLIKKSFSPKAKKQAPAARPPAIPPRPTLGRPAGLAPAPTLQPQPSASMHKLQQPVGLGSLEGDEVDYTPPTAVGFIPKEPIVPQSAPTAPTLEAPTNLGQPAGLTHPNGQGFTQPQNNLTPQSNGFGLTPPAGGGLTAGGDLNLSSAGGLSDSINMQPASGDPLAASQSLMPDHQGLATAPIPKEPLSKKKKIILASLALLITISVLAIFIIRSSNEQAEIDKIKGQVTQIYKGALTAFDDEDFQKCVDNIDKISNDKILSQYYTNRTIGKIYRSIAMARIEIKELKFTEASASCDAAKELINDFEESLTGKKLEKLNPLIRKLKQLETDTMGIISQKNNFSNSLATIEKLINKSKDNSDFSKVKDLISNTLANSSMNLNASQKEAILALKDKLEIRETKFGIEQIISEAKLLEDNAQSELAINKYSELLKALDPKFNPLIEKVDRHYRNRTRAKANSRLAELRTNNKIAALKAPIENAETNEEKIEALTKAIDSNMFTPSENENFRKQIEQLKFAEYLEDAQTKTAEGHVKEAITAWEKILELDPTHEEAKQTLANYAKQSAFEESVKEANRLYLSDKYEQAIVAFEKVLKKDPSAEVADKIKDCKYKIALKKAKAQDKANNYKTAIKLYRKALEINDEDSEEIEQRIEILNSTLQYNATIARANKALADKDYKAARKYFKEAQAIDNTETTRNGIKFADYAIAFARAKKMKDQPIEAAILAKKAQKIMDTKEVRDFIKKMQKKAKSQE